jgi:hypothetical protein
MGKLFLSFIFLMISQVCLSQDSQILTKDENAIYGYEKVFEIPGKSKDEIFSSIKTWVVKNIKTQSNTNFFDEIGKNTISTNPAFVISSAGVGGAIVEFKMNIDIKDGKYRLSGNAFHFFNSRGIDRVLGDYKGLFAKSVRVKVVEEIDKKFQNMLSSIEASAKAEAQGSNW